MSLSSQVSSLATRLGQEVKALWTAVNAKAPLASPTFTGTVVLPTATSVGNVSSTELGYLDGVTSAIQTQLNAKVDEVASTDNAVARFNGTGGSIQNSGITIDDSNVMLNNGLIVPRATISSTAPASPKDGDLWIDTSSPTWTTPTIHSPWSQYGTLYLGYLKDAMGFVNVRGSVAASGSQTGTGNYIFQFPSGYRPAIEQTWIVMAWPGFARCIVATDGTVWIFSYGEGGTSGHVDLSPIRFRPA